MSRDDDSASSDMESEVESPLNGSQKTQLTWDLQNKQLSVHLRQHVETNRKVELNYKGHLNTASGDWVMTGRLRRNFHTNNFSINNVFMAARLQQLRQRFIDAPLPSDGEGAERRSEVVKERREQIRTVTDKLRELDLDPDCLLPAGWRPLLLKDWCISPGVTYDSSKGSGSHLHGALFIKKAPQVLIHSPRTDLLLTAKACAEVDPRNAEVTGHAGLRLKLMKYNVTSRQDLKVTVGLDLIATPLNADMPSSLPNSASSHSLSRTTYLKISENNTSIKWQGGRWIFQYLL